MNVFDYITKEQLSEIIKIIKKRCTCFKQFDLLFYEPYIKMRRNHTLTLAVLSGFAPDKINIDGFTTKDVNYGANNKMAQPELHSEKAIIQIYSNGSTLNNNLIKRRCKEYNQNMKPPIFFVVQFKANQQDLESVDICFFDDEATRTEKINVYPD